MRQNDLEISIDSYEDIEWTRITRERDFPKVRENFVNQKDVVYSVKDSFDLLLNNQKSLVKSLPDSDLIQINDQITIFRKLIEKMMNYGHDDVVNHGEYVKEITGTCFNIQKNISDYVKYLEGIINPLGAKKDIQDKLDELSKLENNVDVKLKNLIETEKEMDILMKELRQGTREKSEGKRGWAGVEIAKYFNKQSKDHRDEREGINTKIFWKIPNPLSYGWKGSRRFFYWIIVLVISIATIYYFYKFDSIISICKDKGIDQCQNEIKIWKEFLSWRTGALFVALLTILYTGLQFSTKNYNLEKELEYKNKNRENIAKTMLLFSAGQDEEVIKIVTEEASKTLFSDIEISAGKGNSDNQNVNISVPQGVATSLANKNQ